MPTPAAGKSNAPDKVRITADLPLSTVEILRDLAAAKDVTLTEALRLAITTEGALHSRLDKNSKLLVEGGDGSGTELILR